MTNVAGNYVRGQSATLNHPGFSGDSGGPTPSVAGLCCLAEQIASDSAGGTA